MVEHQEQCSDPPVNQYPFPLMVPLPWFLCLSDQPTFKFQRKKTTPSRKMIHFLVMENVKQQTYLNPELTNTNRIKGSAKGSIFPL